MSATTSPRRFIIVDDSTIQEKRDRQEERRPKKRQRVDSDDEDDTESLTPSRPSKKRNPIPTAPFSYPTSLKESKEAPERDTVYYKEDIPGTCVVRVKDTLFKIHKELLSCSEVMQSCLEDHEKALGPTSEFQPLQLIAPSVDEFRAFLWALYANAEELTLSPTCDAELSRLFHIAAMSVKYDSPKLSDWVALAIKHAAQNPALMDACSSATLAQFVDVAVYHHYDAALDLILKKWLERLQGKSTPSVPAIQTGDKHEHASDEETRKKLKKLRGVSYYVHVQDMQDRQGKYTESGATQLRTDPKLNNGQVMRLLGGYWSLVSLWERMRLKPIDLPQGASCEGGEAHVKCTATWDRRWISAAGWKRIMGYNSADVLTLLSCLKDQLANDDDLKTGLNPDCRRGGLDEIRKLREKTEDGLAEHFTGCL